LNNARWGTFGLGGFSKINHDLAHILASAVLGFPTAWQSIA